MIMQLSVTSNIQIFVRIQTDLSFIAFPYKTLFVSRSFMFWSTAEGRPCKDNRLFATNSSRR